MDSFHEFIESKPPVSEWSDEDLIKGAELLSLAYLKDTGWELVDDFATHGLISTKVFKDSSGNNVLVGFDAGYAEDRDTMPPMDISTKARMRVRKLLLEYLQENVDEHAVRFDVISVLFRPDNKAAARHMHGYMEAKIG